jgi:hypothetical protein
MYKQLSAAVLLLFCGIGGPLYAAKTESFDPAGSAAANGWMAVGDGLDGQTVGWSNSAGAGGGLCT